METFAIPLPDAYEALLLDVMEKDSTLFMRADQIEAAWRVLMPVLDMWAKTPSSDFPNYAAGSWGPEAAQSLLTKQEHSWPLPTDSVRTVAGLPGEAHEILAAAVPQRRGV